MNGESLGFSKTRPFQKNFLANGKIGKHELTIKAWDYYGNLTEKSIPLRYARQRMIAGDQPMIEKIIPYRNSVSVNLVFPDPSKVEWAEFMAEQGESVIFTQKFDSPPKFVTLQLQKNGAGRTKFQLYTKMKGSKDIYSSPFKTLDL